MLMLNRYKYLISLYCTTYTRLYFMYFFNDSLQPNSNFICSLTLALIFTRLNLNSCIQNNKCVYIFCFKICIPRGLFLKAVCTVVHIQKLRIF